MWPFVTAEQWAEWITSQGYDPTQFTFGGQTDAVEPTTCILCGGNFPPDKLYLQLDPPPGVAFGRKLHPDCLISHFYLHENDMSDEIINYAFRKRIP